MNIIRAGINLGSLLYLMNDLADEKPLRYNRADMMLDAAYLASNLNKTAEFVWQVRESGTCLHEINPKNLRPIRSSAEVWPDSDFYKIARENYTWRIYSMTRDELFDLVGHAEPKSGAEVKP